MEELFILEESNFVPIVPVYSLCVMLLCAIFTLFVFLRCPLLCDFLVDPLVCV